MQEGLKQEGLEATRVDDQGWATKHLDHRTVIHVTGSSGDQEKQKKIQCQPAEVGQRPTA
jgi:hypothetical protein